MRIIELFAGIGACSKALTNIGIDLEIVDAVEIDKFAIQSFNAIHNTNFVATDIREYNKVFNDIDIITHGSPCQDFSIAGKQAGGDKGSGTRSSLLYETIRIVEQNKPKYVLWENVKNLLSEKHRHNFDNYISSMNKIGYNSYYQVLNAKNYGIPQNRERVYTISIRKDIDRENFVFPEKEKLHIRLKDILEKEVDEKYYLKDKGIKYVNKRIGNYTQIIKEDTEIAHCPITALGNTNWTGNMVLDNETNKCIKVGETTPNGGTRSRLAKSIRGMNTEIEERKLTNGIDSNIFQDLIRIQKNINIYIWCNGKQIPEYLDFFVNQNHCKFDILIWNKTNATPLYSNKYMNDKEYCLYFRKNGYCNPKNYNDAKTVWYMPINISDKKKYMHPTIKPLKIIRTLIKNSSNEGDIVLDCFSGSGTTCVAAKELNRKYIGIEIDPEYHKISIDRLEGILANGQTTMFMS